MTPITEEALKEVIDIHVALGADAEDRTFNALLELQARRRNDAITAELLAACKELRDWHQREYSSNRRIDNRVHAAIQKAEEAGLGK